MAKQLNLDELLEAADREGLPTAKPIIRAIESLATALGADLAQRLGVLCGEARFEPLEGLLIAFHARTKWQPCPNVLQDFDPDEWGEAPVALGGPEPDDQVSPKRAETTPMFVARYENRYGEIVTRVFPTTTLAEAWKDEIGRDSWNTRLDGPAPEDAGAAWFERQADHGSESFAIEPCTLEHAL